MSSVEIFTLLEKASSLIGDKDDVTTFKANFPEIRNVISSIPGHEDLVNINGLDTLEEWQLKEFKNTLLEQLNKTKQTWQQLKNTGVDN